MHARANEPIVVVEDFEHLLVNINCAKEGKMMILEFGDVYTATLTFESWAKHSNFVLVTSHPEGNCNPQNDRAAFR